MAEVVVVVLEAHLLEGESGKGDEYALEPCPAPWHFPSAQKPPGNPALRCSLPFPLKGTSGMRGSTSFPDRADMRQVLW